MSKVRIVIAIIVIVGAVVLFVPWPSPRPSRSPNPLVSAQHWNHLGNELLSQGETEAAIVPLRRAVALSPKDPAIMADFGEALGRLKRFQEAVVADRRAVALAPADINYRAMLAIALAHAARTDAEYWEAAKMLANLTNRMPDDESLRAVLAGLHMRFCQFGAAHTALELYVAQSPNLADPWYNLAIVRERLGDWKGARLARVKFDELVTRETAIVEARKQVALQPNQANSHLQLAMALRKSARYDSAFQELQQAAALAPNDARIQRFLSMAKRGNEPATGLTPPDNPIR